MEPQQKQSKAEREAKLKEALHRLAYAAEPNKPGRCLIQSKSGFLYRLNIWFDNVNEITSPRMDAGNVTRICRSNTADCFTDEQLTEPKYNSLQQHKDDPSWVIMGLAVSWQGHMTYTFEVDLSKSWEEFNNTYDGLIYTNKELFQNEKLRWTKKKAEEAIDREVAEFGAFVHGDVFGFTIDEWHPATCPADSEPDVEDSDQFVKNIHSCWRFFFPMQAGSMVNYITMDLEEPWDLFTATTEALMKATSHLDSRAFDCPVCSGHHRIQGFRARNNGYFSGTCQNCKATLEAHLTF